MFPFQSGELSFQVSNDFDDLFNDTPPTNTLTNCTTNYPPSTTNDTTTHILNQPHYQEPIAPNNANLNNKSSTTRKRSKKTTIIDDNTNYTNNNNEDEISVAKKKIIHREVERQRRQEMSALHSSLRSLLPMEYIKGKRSICDHVAEATNYIKDLEKKVKELGEKRDKLKESFSSLENQLISTTRESNIGSSSSSASSSTNSSTCRTINNNINDYNVSIHKFSRTLQIEFSTRIGDEDPYPYPLSKILKVLAQEGLEVVSCVSSIVNQRCIYVIYCENNDVTLIDSSYLHDKLMMSVLPSIDS